jgi:predicted DNA-binding transcriptional regulator AlpA
MFHARTALVTIDTVKSVLGLSTDDIHERIEDGRLFWVWDISVGHHQNRELRFWAREIVTFSLHQAPGSLRVPVLTQALDAIIGHSRPRLRTREIADLLHISRPTIMRLIGQGHLIPVGQITHPNTIWISRDSLIQFLTNRLLGSQPYVSMTRHSQNQKTSDNLSHKEESRASSFNTQP